MADYSILEKIVLASVGLLTSSRKDLEKSVDRAIRRDQKTRKGVLRRDSTSSLTADIKTALSRLGVATASDFEAVLERIERIEQALKEKRRRARRVRRPAGRRRVKAEPAAPPAVVQTTETAVPEPTEGAGTDETAQATESDPSAPQETGGEKAPAKVEEGVQPKEAPREDVGSLPH